MSTRIESDSIGEIEVAADAYWGAQTERSRHNFAFPAHERMPLPIVHALARIKGAAARVNRSHGLDAGLADAIDAAAEAVVAGRRISCVGVPVRKIGGRQAPWMGLSYRR